MSYNLVLPEDFTPEQKKFIESIKDSFRIGGFPPELFSGVKDINSRHIISTDYVAQHVGLSRGDDMTGRFDRDIPCEGVVRFAQNFVDEEKELFSHKDVNRKISILTVLEYTTGIKSQLTDKHVLKHEASKAILGVIFLSHQVDLSYFFTLLPNYRREFGIKDNIHIDEALSLENVPLTTYEHEIGFLMVMRWSFKRIACFMNEHRPSTPPITAETIYKYRDRICQKLNCSALQLRDKLIALNLHRKMPGSFASRLIGNRSIA